jgi:hypothetical protein
MTAEFSRDHRQLESIESRGLNERTSVVGNEMESGFLSNGTYSCLAVQEAREKEKRGCKSSNKPMQKKKKSHFSRCEL